MDLQVGSMFRSWCVKDAINSVEEFGQEFCQHLRTNFLCTEKVTERFVVFYGGNTVSIYHQRYIVSNGIFS